MKYIKLLLIIFLLFGSSLSFAQGTEQDTGATSSTNTEQDTGASNQSNPNGQPENIRLENPLGDDLDTLPELVENILRIVLTIGVPIVALAIIYAGFKFIAAQGNPTKLEEARRTLLYVIIGAGILLAAYVMAEAIVGTINAIRG